MDIGATQTGEAEVPRSSSPAGDDALVLVCDLDGTLVRTDLMFETFWAAFAAKWTAPVPATLALLRGRAALKEHLAGRGKISVESLPYNDEVLAELRAWRARGGRTALVTAADRDLADRIAAHLGLFDEVHGSDGVTNLKGAAKAAMLRERYGDGGYVYIGDSRADLQPWQWAARGISVDARPGLRRESEAMCEMRHIGHAMPLIRPMFRAIRPHQWVKNVLVFLPAIAGHDFGWDKLFLAFLAFVSYSLVASSVYVLNDLLDLASDRAHPRKRYRPFASGTLPLFHGTWMAPGLLLLGVLVALLLGPLFLTVMAVYYVTTTAYSLKLKRLPVLDICTLAALYALRIVAGGVAAGIPLSVWLLAFSIFFFFSLAAVKRQAELVDGIASGREAKGRGYRGDDLPLIEMMAVSSGYVSVMVMALYVNSPEVLTLYENPEWLWGICGVLLFWLSRMVFIAHRGRMDDDPVVFAGRDRITHLMLLISLGFVAAGTLT